MAESDVGTVRIQIQAGLEGARCRPYTELQRQDIGIADEAKSKKSVMIVIITFRVDLAELVAWSGQP